MKIVDAEWTPTVNMLILSCDCGNMLIHPANRWSVTCRKCATTTDLGTLREFNDCPRNQKGDDHGSRS